MGPFSPALEKRIAADVSLTVEQEPDKSDGVPGMDLLAYYFAPQGLSAGTFVIDETQWGIFLTTGGIEYLARVLVADGFDLRGQTLRCATEVLYLHEHFHHLVATTAALHADRVTASGVYETYRQRSDGARGYCELEEALANAFAFRFLDQKEQTAMLAFSRRQPAGYDRADRYLSDSDFRSGCTELIAAIVDAPLSNLELAHLQLFGALADMDGHLVSGLSVRVHIVESDDSAHSAGEWHIP